MTQNERIIRHLTDYGSITSKEAMIEYGIMRLASRINDLRKLGYPIVGETETERTDTESQRAIHGTDWRRENAEPDN